MKNMGKKLSINQASTKISKEDNKKQQYHQLNNMIKILRPKVYITHSSDFKRLVQELTGHGNNTTYYSQIITPPTVHQPPIIDIIEDDHHQETTSLDVSVDMSSSDNNYKVEMLSYADSSPLEAGIVIPEDLDSMLEDMENNNYFPAPPCGGDDNHASFSPPSSSSCDWQLEMMDPFITYNNNLHDDFGDAFYNMPTVEQALYNQQEVCVFENNMELLQW